MPKVHPMDNHEFRGENAQFADAVYLLSLSVSEFRSIKKAVNILVKAGLSSHEALSLIITSRIRRG